MASNFDDAETDLEFESAVEEVVSLSLGDDDSDSKCNSSSIRGLGVASQYGRVGGVGGVGGTPSDSALMSERGGKAPDDSMEAKEATVDMGDVGRPVNSSRRNLWTGSTVDQTQRPMQRKVFRTPRRVTRRRAPSSYEDSSSHSSSDESSEATESTIGSSTDSSTSSSSSYGSWSSESSLGSLRRAR